MPHYKRFSCVLPKWERQTVVATGILGHIASQAHSAWILDDLLLLTETLSGVYRIFMCGGAPAGHGLLLPRTAI